MEEQREEDKVGMKQANTLKGSRRKLLHSQHHGKKARSFKPQSVIRFTVCVCACGVCMICMHKYVLCVICVCMYAWCVVFYICIYTYIYTCDVCGVYV